MNAKSLLIKKIVSISATVLLTLAGSVIATQPAQAAPCAGQTNVTSIHATSLTIDASTNSRIYYNNDSSLAGCVIPLNPTGFAEITLIDGVQVGQPYFGAGSSGIQVSSYEFTLQTIQTLATLSGVTLDDGDIFEKRQFFGAQSSPTTSTTGYLSVQITVRLAPAASTEQVTREVERYIAPAFQAPLFNSLAPQGIIGVSNNGGRLVLKDVKVTDIKSVTLNGTALVVVESKSGSAVKIPAGSKAGDLLFSMTDGTSITVPNAVKVNTSQVDERLADLINLPKFSGSSVKVPAAITKALAKSSALIKSSQNAKCVGYATANTVKAKATALARATNVCVAINNLNETIEPIIKVVVNKKLASASPVKYQTW